MIGKLYVLALIHMMCAASVSSDSIIFDLVSSNAQPPQPDERPTFMSTLTVPAEAMCTTQNPRDDLSDDTEAECEPEGHLLL